jgi:hypothetical protein
VQFADAPGWDGASELPLAFTPAADPVLQRPDEPGRSDAAAEEQRHLQPDGVPVAAPDLDEAHPGIDLPDRNQDPRYLRELLLYRLTLEAQKRVKESPLSKREIVRRLGTSAAQLYRLLDQTNYRKSVDQVLALLQVLNCDVDLVVRTKTA